MSIYIINFWYGKIPLWKSYWLIGELINSLIIYLIYCFEVKLLNNINLYKQLPFLDFASFSLASKVFLFLWTIFITIGIWRSAELYKGKIIWIILTLIFLSYRTFSLRVIF